MLMTTAMSPPYPHHPSHLLVARLGLTTLSTDSCPRTLKAKQHLLQMVSLCHILNFCHVVDNSLHLSNLTVTNVRRVGMWKCTDWKYVTTEMELHMVGRRGRPQYSDYIFVSSFIAAINPSWALKYHVISNLSTNTKI